MIERCDWAACLCSGGVFLACWPVFEVNRRPCEQPWSLHGESHRSLQAPGHYQQQQLHNKKTWKKRGRNLRCSFLMASALTSDIVKDNRHPGNCNTTWWNMERIICFYYKSGVFVSSPHISGTFSFNTEWLRCPIAKLFCLKGNGCFFTCSPLDNINSQNTFTLTGLLNVSNSGHICITRKPFFS